MADALKTFREGEDILASETNENNQFLLSKLSDNAAQVQNYVESEVASIQNNVATAQATLQENITQINETFNTTPHVTEHRTTSTGWVRVWSNGFKEETGYAGVGADGDATVIFTYAFRDTMFSTFATFRQRIQTSGTDNGCAFYPTGTRTGNLVNSLPYGATLTWYASGF